LKRQVRCERSADGERGRDLAKQERDRHVRIGQRTETENLERMRLTVLFDDERLAVGLGLDPVGGERRQTVFRCHDDLRRDQRSRLANNIMDMLNA
jgi:hypothetical protein